MIPNNACFYLGEVVVVVPDIGEGAKDVVLHKGVRRTAVSHHVVHDRKDAVVDERRVAEVVLQQQPVPAHHLHRREPRKIQSIP